MSLTRKTGAQLKSTFEFTLNFLSRRNDKSHARRKGWAVLVPMVPKAESLARGRGFEPMTAGNQIIRLATSSAELDAAQRLRYRVFYDEMGASPLPEVAASRRDFDRYDTACDHLVVVDSQRTDGNQVIGTYRVIRREHARVVGGFYSASEFDVRPLVRFNGNIMELGRSCVDEGYRDRATMQLLWRGIAEYTNSQTWNKRTHCCVAKNSNINICTRACRCIAEVSVCSSTRFN